MRLPDYLKTSAFRFSLMIAAFFTVSSLIVFALIYWQTVNYASQEVDHDVRQTIHAIGSVSPYYVDRRLKRWLSEEIKIERYGLLLAPDGTKVAGNMDRMPDGVIDDGQAYTLHTKGLDGNPEHEDEVIRGAATKLVDGRRLFVGVDTDEWESFRDAIWRALALGVIPTVALACLGGAIFGRATLGRLTEMGRSIDRIVHGDLFERLPHGCDGSHDELDLLASHVNVMLDDIQRLLLEVQAVGDTIAHDLRTPLTRMRARLENAKAKSLSAEQLRTVVDESIIWLDQALGIITSVLRIGEIEHGQRRAAFNTFDAVGLVREVHDLMNPLAEEKEVTFDLQVEMESVAITGDKELMIEALVNLVDNAIKYTPPRGACLIGLMRSQTDVRFVVRDSGPGIPDAERQSVLRPFYKAAAHRHRDGSGLGLALVAAVARLHNLELIIGDNRPGCSIELRGPYDRTSERRRQMTELVEP